MSGQSNALKALIVDDEPPARKRLRRLLEPHVHEGRIDVIGEASDGVEALDLLEKVGADIVFLDIQMPELNGFDVLERLSPECRPVVVFTTAYDSYALRAFEANAIDYLLKPVSKERLAETVARASRASRRSDARTISGERLEKLLHWIDAQHEAEQEEVVEKRTPVRQLSVPVRDRILLIAVERVISAEINEGITRVFVRDEDERAPRPGVRQHVVDYTLDQLESMLPSDRFMRVHRSSIVQLEAIQELIPWFSGRYKLVLYGDHEVIASRERSKHLRDVLMI